MSYHDDLSASCLASLLSQPFQRLGVNPSRISRTKAPVGRRYANPSKIRHTGPLEIFSIPRVLVDARLDLLKSSAAFGVFDFKRWAGSLFTRPRLLAIACLDPFNTTHVSPDYSALNGASAVSSGPSLDYRLDYRPLFQQREDRRNATKYQIS